MSLTILVCGGTGLQGRGFIDYVLKSDKLRFRDIKLRTITRNSNSKNAKLLKAKGIDVLEGSLLDLTFLKSALRNVDILFAATFSDHDGTEVQQGTNLGQAAVTNHIDCVIFSGGESIGIDQMDNKSKIEAYFRSLPLKKIMYLHSSFFFENIATKRGTKRVKVDNFKNRQNYTFSIPLKQYQKISFISPYDIGLFAAHLISDETLINSYPHNSIIPIAGDILSPDEFIQTFSKLTKKNAHYEEFSLDFFRQLPIPGAHLIVLMYQWYHAGCPGEGHDRDPIATRQICPAVRNCQEWLQTNGIALIEEAVYEDNIFYKIQQLLMYLFIRCYGSILWIKTIIVMIISYFRNSNNNNSNNNHHLS